MGLFDYEARGLMYEEEMKMGPDIQYEGRMCAQKKLSPGRNIKEL